MMKKILFCFLAFVIIFSFVSCKSDKEQGDNEGSNNSTQEDLQNIIQLTKDGKPNFQVVMNFKNATSELRNEVRKFTSAFEKNGDSVILDNGTNKNTVGDIEILIGDGILYRDEYLIDKTPLGIDGFAVKVVGNKIVIVAGSDEMLLTAFNWFRNDYLKISEGDTSNLTVSRELNKVKKQNYDVDKITIGGVELDKYKIAFDDGDAYSKETANTLKHRFYYLAGYSLDLVNLDCTDDNLIIIKNNVKTVEDGYRVKLSGGNLIIECALPKVLGDATFKFLGKYFSLLHMGSIELEDDFLYEENIMTIGYCSYGGAVGDGVADDFEAIKKTHERANYTGQTVVAESGKIFNMGKHNTSIPIMTNTVFTGAKFIIDDTDIASGSKEARSNIFVVKPELKSYNLQGIISLKKGQKNIGIKLKQKCLIYIENSNCKQYIRYGGNANSGASMHEIILVDKDGNVDPSTPIMWDYDVLTSVTAYPCEDKPILIEGGAFHSISNNAKVDSYFARGILIRRSNVTMRGIVHTIDDSRYSYSAAYYGFFGVSNCNNTLIEDCKIMGRKKYGMGTYELTGSCANNITWRNLIQTNDIRDNKYWGVMGTNYCKNLLVDGCKISRFDAHQGVYNATILNSELGYQRINAIGMGTLRVENTTLHGNVVVNLRSDYGSTWRGDLILKNITLVNNPNYDVKILSGYWYNHKFGYTCYMPENIFIEGIKLKNKPKANKSIYIFDVFAKNGMTIDEKTVGGKENLNPYVLTQKVEISGVDGFKVSSNMKLFSKVSVVTKGKENQV